MFHVEHIRLRDGAKVGNVPRGTLREHLIGVITATRGKVNALRKELIDDVATWAALETSQVRTVVPRAAPLRKDLLRRG